jgi:hypothetical protein
MDKRKYVTRAKRNAICGLSRRVNKSGECSFGFLSIPGIILIAGKTAFSTS